MLLICDASVILVSGFIFCTHFTFVQQSRMAFSMFPKSSEWFTLVLYVNAKYRFDLYALMWDVYLDDVRYWCCFCSGFTVAPPLTRQKKLCCYCNDGWVDYAHYLDASMHKTLVHLPRFAVSFGHPARSLIASITPRGPRRTCDAGCARRVVIQKADGTQIYFLFLSMTSAVCFLCRDVCVARPRLR